MMREPTPTVIKSERTSRELNNVIPHGPFNPSTRAPALAGGIRSRFRPTGLVECATGLPVGLHRFRKSPMDSSLNYETPRWWTTSNERFHLAPGPGLSTAPQKQPAPA